MGTNMKGKNVISHRQLGLPTAKQTRRQTTGNADESPILELQCVGWCHLHTGWDLPSQLNLSGITFRETPNPVDTEG